MSLPAGSAKGCHEWYGMRAPSSGLSTEVSFIQFHRSVREVRIQACLGLQRHRPIQGVMA